MKTTRKKLTAEQLYQKAYRKKHKKHIKALCKDWRERNLERVKEKNKAYKKANKEKVDIQAKKWRASKKGKAVLKKNHIKWLKLNKDRQRVLAKKYYDQRKLEKQFLVLLENSY